MIHKAIYSKSLHISEMLGNNASQNNLFVDISVNIADISFKPHCSNV